MTYFLRKSDCTHFSSSKNVRLKKVSRSCVLKDSRLYIFIIWSRFVHHHSWDRRSSNFLLIACSFIFHLSEFVSFSWRDVTSGSGSIDRFPIISNVFHSSMRSSGLNFVRSFSSLMMLHISSPATFVFSQIVFSRFIA